MADNFDAVDNDYGEAISGEADSAGGQNYRLDRLIAKLKLDSDLANVRHRDMAPSNFDLGQFDKPRGSSTPLSLLIPGFQYGGDPPPGKPIVVGEGGPEVFVPQESGTIVPNHNLAVGGAKSSTANTPTVSAYKPSATDEIASYILGLLPQDRATQYRMGNLIGNILGTRELGQGGGEAEGYVPALSGSGLLPNVPVVGPAISAGEHLKNKNYGMLPIDALIAAFPALRGMGIANKLATGVATGGAAVGLDQLSPSGGGIDQLLSPSRASAQEPSVKGQPGYNDDDVISQRELDDLRRSSGVYDLQEQIKRIEAEQLPDSIRQLNQQDQERANRFSSRSSVRQTLLENIRHRQEAFDSNKASRISAINAEIGNREVKLNEHIEKTRTDRIQARVKQHTDELTRLANEPWINQPGNEEIAKTLRYAALITATMVGLGKPAVDNFVSRRAVKNMDRMIWRFNAAKNSGDSAGLELSARSIKNELPKARDIEKLVKQHHGLAVSNGFANALASLGRDVIKAPLPAATGGMLNLAATSFPSGMDYLKIPQGKSAARAGQGSVI